MCILYKICYGISLSLYITHNFHFNHKKPSHIYAKASLYSTISNSPSYTNETDIRVFISTKVSLTPSTISASLKVRLIVFIKSFVLLNHLIKIRFYRLCSIKYPIFLICFFYCLLMRYGNDDIKIILFSG